MCDQDPRSPVRAEAQSGFASPAPARGHPSGGQSRVILAEQSEARPGTCFTAGRPRMPASMPPPEKSLLPARHERVAFVNILLLLALPLLAYLLHFLSISDTEEVDFLSEGVPTLLAYPVAAFGLLQAWRRARCRETFRTRAGRAAAALARWQSAFVRGARARPLAALWTAALLGVLVSCYPVVFAGRSFVSPNSAEQLVYNHAPTVPGMQGKQFLYNQGSDTGAMMWQNLPYSVIEHRAIFQDHELPVWNRYDAGGLTMIGQGLSMIGDPLNLAVVLAGGTSWAWDVRYLVARLLFAAGIGLCVRSATGRLGGTLVLTFSACFLGFFIYRFNHPAYFAVCYAPWVLLPWLWLVGEPDRDERALRRQRWRWAFLLLAACWCEFSSGTVKEPVILLLCLNVTGGGLLLLDERGSWRWKRQRFAQAAWMGVCFLLLSAPLWRTFLTALAQSWTAYEKSVAWQLQPGLLLGLFDDIFYRQFNSRECVLDPSLNFAVLLGVLFAVASCRALMARSRVFLALGLGALGAAAVVFGVIPPKWICAVPFLSKIQHTDNTFSCALMVLLPVLAGFGLERCRELLRRPRFAGNYGAAAACFLILWAAFFGLTQAAQRSTFSPLSSVGNELQLTPFFRGYAATLFVACLAVPLLLRWWHRAGPAAGYGVLPALLVCWSALLWRGGLHTNVSADWAKYVVYPGERVDLRTTSPALDRLMAANRLNPGVCLGFDHTLMGGYMALFGLETVITVNALQNPYYRDLDRRSSSQDLDTMLAGDGSQAPTSHLTYYDLLGVRYYGATVIPGATAAPAISGLRVLGHHDLDVYESPTAWPRAFFTDSYVPCRRVADVFHALGKEDGRPFAAVAPEDIEAGAGDAPALGVSHGDGGDAGRTVVPATGYRLTTRTTNFHLRTPGSGIVVLGEGYHTDQDTRVYLDGRPVPHFRANWAFTGFRVTAAGEHDVRVVYGPRSLPVLLGVSLLGAVLLAGTALLVRPGHRSARQPAAGEERLPGSAGGGAMGPTVPA